jgi:hypothetical protein
MTSTPGASRRISRASSAVIGFSNSMFHRFRMTDEHRHAHAGRGQLDLRIEDLLGLGHHLPLFLGGAVLHEDVDMRNDVEGDALGELLGSRPGSADEDRAGLANSSSMPSLPAPETDW